MIKKSVLLWLPKIKAMEKGEVQGARAEDIEVYNLSFEKSYCKTRIFSAQFILALLAHSLNCAKIQENLS